MTVQVVEPRVRGFVSLTAHPEGCAAEVARQIGAVGRPVADRAGGKALVIGSSTGYGLASRIAAAFGHGMDTIGISYERPATDRRSASAGWYNLAAFQSAAAGDGLYAHDVIGDAFSKAVLNATLERIAADLGQVDRVVYSIAAPRRTHPETGTVYESVLKTVGEPFAIKTVDLRTEEVTEAVIEPATGLEVASTVAVMGGDDLARWTDALLHADLLASGAQVVAFSYIGPEVTWPIYKHGTIGLAKQHLHNVCNELDEHLAADVGGGCHVSINKSVVTQASAAIPGVPLYMSLLFGVMKEAGLHEGPIEQMGRLFENHFGPGRTPGTDDQGLIRLDDLEMRPEIQAETLARWQRVSTDNLRTVADWDGYSRDFSRLFGFQVDGLDYGRPVETEQNLPAVEVFA